MAEIVADQVVVTVASDERRVDVLVEDWDAIEIADPGREAVVQVETGIRGLQGPTGTIERAFHRHVQELPAASWSIPHDLAGYPNVTVVDSARNVVVGEVSYPDATTVRVDFIAAFSGEAFLS